jgi:hypothetical protein
MLGVSQVWQAIIMIVKQTYSSRLRITKERGRADKVDEWGHLR